MTEVYPELPDLEILGRLGTGGMSSVWKAYHKGLEKVVAVKIMDPKLAADPEEVKLFIAEERAMEEIDHQGIVKSYELCNYGAAWYYIMEYVDGYNFGALLARKQNLIEVDCLLICESVASALDYAWNEHGVVHCDIKPENIMINTDGVVKLTDLGLCQTYKFMNEGLKEVPDHVLGTPAYISPEQVYGDVELDCRADIYELAATLYHLATGRVLFPGMNFEDMMRAHCSDSFQAQDPRDFKPALSEGFCQLLEAMLVKNRDFRVPNWKDVLNMSFEVEQGLAFKARKGPASSLRLNGVEPDLSQDYEDDVEGSEEAESGESEGQFEYEGEGQAEAESEGNAASEPESFSVYVVGKEMPAAMPAEMPPAPKPAHDPRKKVFHYYKGGGKSRHEPQIQIDPKTGKKILRKARAVNNGFKINKPAW